MEKMCILPRSDTGFHKMSTIFCGKIRLKMCILLFLPIMTAYGNTMAAFGPTITNSGPSINPLRPPLPPYGTVRPPMTPYDPIWPMCNW